MAKKTNDLDIDQMDDLDLDFDIPEMGMPGDDMKSRSPVTKLSASFAKGAAEELTRPQDISRKLKMVMPREYTSSIDLVDDAASTVTELYDSIRRETANGVRQLKTATRKAISPIQEKLPRWLNKGLDRLLATDPSYGDNRQSESQIRESEIQNTLAGIFQLQEQKDVKEKREEGAYRQLRDMTSDLQNEALVSQLISMREDVRRQVTYQDMVESRVDRKMLELQYRHFFVSRDLLALTEESTRSQKEALAAIVKNTGLPEFQKLKMTEAGHQQFRERMLEGIHNGVMSLPNIFLNSRRNLVRNVRERSRNFGDILSQIASGIEMGTDSADMLDPYDMVGGMAGGGAGGYLFNRVSPAIRRYLEKNPQIQSLGIRASNFANNLPRGINEFAQRDHGYGLWGRMMNFLSSNVDTRRLDSSIAVQGVEDSRGPAIFDNITRRSIVEIIPGFLSRIHHELKGFRQGMGVPDPGPDDRMTYNIRTRGFENYGNARKTIRDDLFRPQDLEQSSKALDKMYDDLDIAGNIDAKLRGDAFQAIRKHLVRENLSGNQIDVRRLADAGRMMDQGVGKEVAEAIAAAVTQRYGIEDTVNDQGDTVRRVGQDDETQRQIGKLIQSFNQLTQNINDPKRRVAGYVELGQEDMLKDLGFVKNNQYGLPTAEYEKFIDVIARGGFADTLKGTDADRAEQRRWEQYKDKKEKQELDEERKKRQSQDSMAGAEGKARQWFQRANQPIRKIKDAVKEAVAGETNARSKESRYQLGTRATQKNRGLGAKAAYEAELRDAGVDTEAPASESLLSRAAKRIQSTVTRVSDGIAGDSIYNDLDRTRRVNIEADGSGDEALPGISELGRGIQNVPDPAGEVRGPVDPVGNERRTPVRSAINRPMGFGGSINYNGPSYRSYATSYTEAPDARFKITPVDNDRSTETQLLSTVIDIRKALNETQGNIAENFKGIREYLDRPVADNVPNERKAEFAVLSRILETLEAIGSGIQPVGVKGESDLSKVTARSRAVLSAVGKGLGDYYSGAFKLFGGLLGGAGTTAQALGTRFGTFVSSKYGQGKDWVEDVFTKDYPDKPVLEAVKMKMGEYYDSATGHVITSLDQLKNLKGNITNKDGTITYATAAELSKGIYDRARKRIDKTGWFKKTRSGLNYLSGLAGGYMGLTTAPLRLLKTGIGKSVTKLRDFANRPVDVYVKGESKPRLVASVMKAGGYVSAATGRPIFNVKAIDGDVKDLAGNTVLALTDIQQGLTDVNGRSLSFAVRNLQRLKDYALKPYAWLRSKYRAAKAVGHSGFDTVRDFIKGKRGEYKNSEGIMGSGSPGDRWAKAQVDILRDIRQTVRSIAKSQKRNVFDSDNDGDRDGSWQDLFAKRKEGHAAEQGPAKEGTKSKKSLWGYLASLLGFVKNIPGMLAGVFGFSAGGLLATLKDKLLGGLGFGENGLLATLSDKLSGKFGEIVGDFGDKLFGNLKDFAKTIVLGSEADDLDDLGGNGRGRRHNRTKIKRGLKARRLRLARAARNAGSAGRLARYGSMALRGGLMAGELALGAVSAPALITGAVVVGVGVGGYLLWKKYHKKTYDQLTTHRMLQYGVFAKQSEAISKILYLEDQLKESIKIDGNRVNLINAPEGMTLVKEFGGDPTNQDDIDAMVEWYNGRFLPVFTANRLALTRISRSVALADVDKLDPIDKLTFFRAAQEVRAINPGYPPPYNFRSSPFPAIATLGVEPQQIADSARNITRSLKEAASKASKPEIAKATNGIAPLRYTAPNADKATPMPLSRTVRPPVPQAMQGTGQLLLRNQPQAAPAAIVSGMSVAPPMPGQMKLNPQQAMVFLAMGLKDFEPGKVQALQTLINAVIPDVRVDGKGRTAFTGDARKLYSQYGHLFGLVNPLDQLSTQRWVRWFSDRFVPVLLCFIKTVLNGKTIALQAWRESVDRPLLSMRAGQALSALTIDTPNGTVSIWQLGLSPWGDYSLNSDPKTLAPYIDYLRSKVPPERLQAEGSKGGVDSKDPSTQKYDTDAVMEAFLSKDKLKSERLSIAQDAVRKLHNKPPINKNQVGDRGDLDAYSQEQSANYHLGGPATITGGQPIVQPGNGTGGDINNIPMPTGEKGYAAMKGTILAAAKMAGVDPGLMATMASIESSFQSGVKADSSSATGLYQFITDTWKEMLNRYGSKYGISPATPRSDPRANALMAAEYLKENSRALATKVKRNLTDVDLYAAHFLGAGGARDLLTADPTTDATILMPAAASSNPSIFREEDGRPRSVAGVYAELNRRVSGHRKRYADDARASAGVMAVKDPAGNKVDTLPPADPVASAQSPVPPEAVDGVVPSAPPLGNDTSVVKIGASSVSKPTQSPDGGMGDVPLMMARNDADTSMQSARAKVAAGGGDASGYAIDTALDRNSEAAIAQQNQAAQRAWTQDQEAQKRQEDQNDNISNITGLLSQSLKAQMSMDTRLEAIVALLRQRRGPSGAPDLDNSSQASTAADTAAPKRSNVGGDPRRASDPVVGMGRKRSA